MTDGVPGSAVREKLAATLALQQVRSYVRGALRLQSSLGNRARLVFVNMNREPGFRENFGDYSRRLENKQYHAGSMLLKTRIGLFCFHEKCLLILPTFRAQLQRAGGAKPLSPWAEIVV